jgi:hypothetical protein
MDARFQDDLVMAAKRAGKLPFDYHVPESARENRPEVLNRRFAGWRKRGLFPEFPFGSDFTPEEIVLAKALRALTAHMASWSSRATLLRRAVQTKPDGKLSPYLQRMSLLDPKTLRQRIEQRLLSVTLADVIAQDHNE